MISLRILLLERSRWINDRPDGAIFFISLLIDILFLFFSLFPDQRSTGTYCRRPNRATEQERVCVFYVQYVVCSDCILTAIEQRSVARCLAARR